MVQNKCILFAAPGEKNTPSFPHMSKEDTYPGRPEQDLPLAQKKEDISFLFLPPRIQSGHVNAEEEETFSKQASRAHSPFFATRVTLRPPPPNPFLSFQEDEYARNK